MDLSYKKQYGSIEIGIGGATISEVVIILKELLPDYQPEIDKLTAAIKGLTGRLNVSATALQGAISKEKEQ